MLLAGGGASIVGFIVFCVALLSPDVTYDALGYPHEEPSSGLTTGIVIFGLGVVAMILGSHVARTAEDIHRIRKKILSGDFRSHFVTPKDYSYGVVFGDTALASYKRRKLEDAQKIDAFFALPSIIKADKEIKEAGKGLRGIEQAYQAKLVVIDAAKRLYTTSMIDANEHISSLRAEAAHAFDLRLTAIKNDAQRKLERAEELERAHNVTPTPTDR